MNAKMLQQEISPPVSQSWECNDTLADNKVSCATQTNSKVRFKTQCIFISLNIQGVSCQNNNLNATDSHSL